MVGRPLREQLGSAADCRERAFQFMCQRLNILLDIIFTFEAHAHLLEGLPKLCHFAAAEAEHARVSNTPKDGGRA